MDYIHCVIYARTDTDLKHLGNVNVKALVLMILRHDGKIGLPGGRIEPGESWTEALRRELMEEINFRYPVDTVVHRVTRHLAAIEITEKQFIELERCALDAEHYGSEVFGVMRVPLFTNSQNRGFPEFVKNNFWGDPRQEIERTLQSLNVI